MTSSPTLSPASVPLLVLGEVLEGCCSVYRAFLQGHLEGTCPSVALSPAICIRNLITQVFTS